jgi:protein-tyrosine-phosphatase
MHRILILILGIALAGGAAAADIDWGKVDQAIGKPGTTQPGGVRKYGLPRSDLTITVDGVAIKPTFALGSWIGFLPMGTGVMLMGDLVLTEHEIEPVMKRLIDDGVEITAVHNHLLRTSPAVFYMHVGGHGDPVKLARTLHAGLALSQTPFAAAAPAATPPTIDLDTAAIDAALEAKGTINGGVYQFNIPRADPITEAGMAVPPSMGTAIAINFQPTGSGKAAITGDFVLLGKEVNPVLKAMRDNGIEVTALHSHMIDDSPHLFFMHFWANDDVAKLTRGLRAALDLANVRPKPSGESAKPAAKSGSKTGTIVFVCRYGSAKSVVAARFFNRIAAQEGLPFHAVARGIEPEPVIPPYVREPIRADRFEIGPEEKPVPLDAGETRDAVAVVCIMCKLPPGQLAVARQSIEWTDVPDVSDGYAAARDRILGHMKELMVRLGAK